MKLVTKAVVAGAMLAMAGAHAAVTSTFSTSAPMGMPSYSFDDLSGNSMLSISGGTIKVASQTNVALRPEGSSGGFWSIDPTTPSGSISFTNLARSVSFLWGSPDAFNSLNVLLDGGGSMSIDPFASGGSNGNSHYVTLTASGGSLISGLSFASSDFGFEVDNLYVSAVPEPETYALMLAGLAAVAFVARRQRKG